MQYFSQIFKDTMSLHVGTNSQCFHEYQDFFHVESFFNDQWCNFIVPKMKDPIKLDMQAVNKIIEEEDRQGRPISFYINQDLISNYEKFMMTFGYKIAGNDCYLIKNLSDSSITTLPSGYSFNHEYDLNQIIPILETCFSGWVGERVYSEAYENYKIRGQEDRSFETYVINYGTEPVGAGSISVDKNLNLGYLHNTGISQIHRKKGIHSALINERCNFCLNQGVNRVLSLVEENSISFHNFQKNGFVALDKFFVFIKSD